MPLPFLFQGLSGTDGLLGVQGNEGDPVMSPVHLHLPYMVIVSCYCYGFLFLSVTHFLTCIFIMCIITVCVGAVWTLSPSLTAGCLCNHKAPISAACNTFYTLFFLLLFLFRGTKDREDPQDHQESLADQWVRETDYLNLVKFWYESKHCKKFLRWVFLNSQGPAGAPGFHGKRGATGIKVLTQLYFFCTVLVNVLSMSYKKMDTCSQRDPLEK